MRVSAELPLGVASLFGSAARARRQLEAELVAGLDRLGFDEVILPILDYVDPYRPILGEAVRSELYRFTGRDGETLALRSDFTPMLARLLAPRVDELELPAKLFYRGDVVRFRPPRVGDRREMYQLGAELLGRPGEAAEAEALDTFLQLLERIEQWGRAAEGGKPRVVLGVAGALDELLGLAPVPSDLVEAVVRRERAAARGLSEALLQVVERGLPRDLSELGPAAHQDLSRLVGLVDRQRASYPNVNFEIDLAEFAAVGSRWGKVAAGARSYYDGIVFRAYLGNRSGPIGGGGRYDRLFERLGAGVSAVGFSLGLDGLVAAVAGEEA